MPGGGGSGSRGFGSNKAKTSYDQFRSDISKNNIPSWIFQNEKLPKIRLQKVCFKIPSAEMWRKAWRMFLDTSRWLVLSK